MDFSRFFIDRPIFAAVLSILTFAAGLIAIPLLPTLEYPDVVPPSVVVRAQYPGANPHTIAEIVANPLEEAINGVEDMVYMKSVSGSDGVLHMMLTFHPGTDPDEAAVKVQNRVSQALPRLPEDVRRQGVVTQKRTPTSAGRGADRFIRNSANLSRLHLRQRLQPIRPHLAGDCAGRRTVSP